MIFRKKEIKIREIPREHMETAAYYHWLKRDCPLGDPLTDWLVVEREGISKRSWWKKFGRTNRKEEPFIPSIEHA